MQINILAIRIIVFFLCLDKFYALSQAKVRTNSSFGRFCFQLLLDHKICLRMVFFKKIKSVL